MLRRFLIVALVAVVNLVFLETLARLIVVHAKPTTGKTATYDRKFELASKKYRDKPEILLMGDSIMHFGVYPELLDAKLNSMTGNPTHSAVNSLNLASPSTSPTMNLLLLKQAVRRNGEPRLVVYNFSPRVFNRNRPPDSFDHVFEDSLFYRCHNDDHHAFSVRFRCFFEENLALLRYRAFLKDEAEKISKTMFRFDKRLKFPDSNPGREMSSTGWAPAYSIHTEEELLREYRDNPKVAQIFRNEMNRYAWSAQAIAPFLKYCGEKKIPVLVIWLPEHPLADRYYETAGVSRQKLAASLKALAVGKDVYVIDWHDKPMSTREFADLDHLNPLGVVKITADLAELLQRPPIASLLKPH